MLFSYRVKGEYIIKDMNIPVETGKCILLTGIENRSFSLIGGIVSGLFPVDDKTDIPQVEELVKDFTGDLEIIEGKVPESAVYLGPDPERHLLFSHVDEEIFAQTGKISSNFEVLSRFGLDKKFIKRKISTLSGGEKMKLALSIVFSKAAFCIVLHGIMPWLDNKGKSYIIREIKERLKEGRCIVILEQELDCLREIADSILYFDGSHAMPFHINMGADFMENIKVTSGRISDELCKKRDTEEIVQFNSVRFNYDKTEKNAFLLNNVTLNLKSPGIYGLIGDNGTGKSTIAKLILRIESPVEGKITFFGRNLAEVERSELVRKICFMSQFPEQHITLSSAEQYKRWAEKCGNSISKRLISKYFTRKSFPIATLSPLQLKILSISAFVCESTKLIILDEPTWGIDLDGEVKLLEVLLDITQELEDISILMISHDLNFISKLHSEILWLTNGSIYFYKDVDCMKQDEYFKKYYKLLDKYS